MSRSLIIWRARVNELESATRVWLPRVDRVLMTAREGAVNTYKLTQDITATVDQITQYLDVPLRQRLEALYFDTATRFIKRRAEQVKGETPSDIPELAAWNAETVALRVNRISRATRNSLRDLIRNALAQNLGIADVIKLMQKAPIFTQTRATLIARTELYTAANAATHFSMRLEYDPAQLLKEWCCFGDESVRTSHNTPELQQRIPYAQPFVVDNFEMQFPGDTSFGAPAREITNCRCIVLYYPR